MGRRKRIEDDELLAIARDVFVEDGFGASTREIARRAKVSEAILFQRFRTKPELFFAAMVPPAPDVEAILAAPQAEIGPGVQLEEIAVRVLEYFRKITPVLIPLMAHPGFDYEEFTRRSPESPLNRLIEALLGWLGEMEAAGATEKRRADTAAMTLLTSLLCLALLERMGVHGGETDEADVRDVARLVWRGLGAPD